MRTLRRTLAAIVLVLAAVGIVCCAAGAIEVWILRQDVARRVEAIDARVEVGVQRTSAANHSVQHALLAARDDLQRVSKAAADLGPDPEKSRPAADALRKLLRERVEPRINEFRARLATFSDVAVAIASVLESFQELPLGEASHQKPDMLERATDQASQLSAALQKLQATIGEAGKAIVDREVVAAVNEVDRVLQKCQATLDDWQSDLNTAGEKLASLMARILGWLTLAAVVVTVLCAWGMLSQFSLAAHAWSWVRGA